MEDVNAMLAIGVIEVYQSDWSSLMVHWAIGPFLCRLMKTQRGV